jgi:hypothetical protein
MYARVERIRVRLTSSSLNANGSKSGNGLSEMEKVCFFASSFSLMRRRLGGFGEFGSIELSREAAVELQAHGISRSELPLELPFGEDLRLLLCRSSSESGPSCSVEPPVGMLLIQSMILTILISLLMVVTRQKPRKKLR